MQCVKDISVSENKLPILATKKYLSSLNFIDDYGYFIEENYILPYIVKKHYFLKYVQFVTNIIDLGNSDNNIEEQIIFFDNVIKYLKKHKVSDFINCRSSAIFPFKPKKSFYCRFGSYIVDLRENEDTLFKKMHSKHRNVIRKAEKDNVQIYNGVEYYDDCVRIIKETYARQNKIVGSDNHFDQFLRLDKYSQFWIAKWNGEIQGCAIYVWSPGQTCYYIHGGSIEQPHIGSLNLLQWKAMLYMKSKSVENFDFVGARINPPKGSKYEGIQRFKERFGGCLCQGYIFKIKINKLKYLLFICANYVYCLLKGSIYKGDVIDQERKRGMI